MERRYGFLLHCLHQVRQRVVSTFPRAKGSCRLRRRGLCSHTSGYRDLNDAACDYVWTPTCTRAISVLLGHFSASVHSLPSFSLIVDSDLYRLFIISRPLLSKDGITGARAIQPSSDVDISRLYPRISQLGNKLCMYFAVNVLDVSAVFRNLSLGILG
jgi:hypothetical protein